jgi:hypothetical protein
MLRHAFEAQVAKQPGSEVKVEGFEFGMFESLL